MPCSNGDYQVRFRDVFLQLQNSPAAIIAGPGKSCSTPELEKPSTNPGKFSDPVAIGMPDANDHSYTRRFAVGVVDSIADELGESEVINMPKGETSGIIELRITEVCMPFISSMLIHKLIGYHFRQTPLSNTSVTSKTRAMQLTQVCILFDWLAI